MRVRFQTPADMPGEYNGEIVDADVAKLVPEDTFALVSPDSRIVFRGAPVAQGSPLAVNFNIRDRYELFPYSLAF